MWTLTIEDKATDVDALIWDSCRITIRHMAEKLEIIVVSVETLVHIRFSKVSAPSFKAYTQRKKTGKSHTNSAAL